MHLSIKKLVMILRRPAHIYTQKAPRGNFATLFLLEVLATFYFTNTFLPFIIYTPAAVGCATRRPWMS